MICSGRNLPESELQELADRVGSFHYHVLGIAPSEYLYAVRLDDTP